MNKKLGSVEPRGPVVKQVVQSGTGCEQDVISWTWFAVSGVRRQFFMAPLRAGWHLVKVGSSLRGLPA